MSLTFVQNIVREPCSQLILNALRSVFFFSTVLFLSQSSSAQLVINEVSNGPTGSEEFIEFVVQCNDPGGVRDIRNWIFDDNSGLGSTCATGEGLTCGHARFSYHNQWAAIPCGAIILIYNDGAPPPNMPSIDPFDSNKDFVYVLPASNPDLLVSDDSSPGHAQAVDGCNDLCNNFNPPFNLGMDWSSGKHLQLDDAADLIQVRSFNGQLSQIVAYGYDDLDQFPSSVKFPESGLSKSFQLQNTVDHNFMNQSNWTAVAASDDSPANANSAANLDWIVSMRLDLEIIDRTVFCDLNEESIRFGVVGSGYNSVEWNFGDQSSGVSNNAAGTQAIHNFELSDPSQGEVFLVTAKVKYPPFDQVIERSFVVEVGPIGPDPSWESFSVCVDSGNFLLDDYLQGTPNGEWSGDVVNSGYVVTQNLSVGSYDITYTVTENGCERSMTQSIDANLNADATWEPLSICKDENTYDLNEQIVGQTGGEWSGDIVNSNGFFNPTDYNPGLYNMTYEVGDNDCKNSFTALVEITDEANADFQSTTTCVSTPLLKLNDLLLGDAGGTWSGDQVVDGNFMTTGLFPGDYEVSYTVGTGGCEKTSTEFITINPSQNPAWQDTMLCVLNSSIDLNQLILGDTGGKFYGKGVVNNEFVYDGFDPGPYEITYVVGPCEDALTKTIFLIQDSSPAWEPQVICYSGEPILLDFLTSFDSGGFWSGGFYVNNNVFDPEGLPPGAYSLTYTVGPYPCLHSETHDILVVIEADAEWETTTICQEDEPLDLGVLVNGHAGGTWSGGAYIEDGYFNPEGLSDGFYDVTYIVGSADCESQKTQSIEVRTAGDASWQADFICQSDEPIDLNNWLLGQDGGTWYLAQEEIDNIIDPATLDLGVHELTYAIEGNDCITTYTTDFEIGNEQSPDWTGISICANSGDIDLNSQVMGTPNGTWLGGQVSENGIFNTDGLKPGDYEIEYHIGDGICARSQMETVTILEIPNPTWERLSFCEGDEVVNLELIAETTGGSWTINGEPIDNPSAFVIEDLGLGSYELTHTVELDGCTDSETDDIEILQYPVAAFDTYTLCLNELPFSLEDLVTGNGGGTWSGDGVTEDGVFDPDDTHQGDYLISYSVSNENCESGLSQFMEIVPLWQEEIEITGETELDLGESSQLEATGAINYSWSPAEGLSCTDCPNPVASPLETTTYTVEGIDRCSQFNTITVEVDSELLLIFPTAFSPNFDDINDKFRPITKNVVEFEMSIFNRWGELVFQTDEMEKGWNGRSHGEASAVGTYLYIASYKYYGQTISRSKKGSITLIR